MNYTLIGDLSIIAANAQDQCQSTSRNLVLPFEFAVDLLDSSYAQAYKSEAESWQLPTCPNELHFNHGQYIHAYSDGIKGVIDRLKQNSAGTRAFYSLVGMKEILECQEILPSFLILQFAVENDFLYATAYFRALEVAEFLPRNIAEICIVCQAIRREVPKFSKIRLLIHAFQGFSRPGFDRLTRPALDRQLRGAIAVKVVQGDKVAIQQLLESKQVESSKIATDGLEELHNALELWPSHAQFSRRFRELISDSLVSLKKLKEERRHHSYAGTPKQEYGRFQQLIDDAIKELHK